MTADRRAALDDKCRAALVKFGFDTGDYMCRCADCGLQFQGAKRSWRCRPCAEAKATLALQNIGQDTKLSEETSRRAALVEKVADVIAKAWDEHGRVIDAATTAISLIRAETLEEAARVAETVGGTSPEDDVWQGAYKAAAAIRALKDAPPNNALTEPTAGLSANP